jgi:hypothetical protein
VSEDAARKRVDRALDRLGAHLARRGITSTGAALGLLLAREVSVAVPAGVAASVAAMAMAGAGVGTAMAGASAVLALAASKVAIGAAAVAVLAAAGTTVYRVVFDDRKAPVAVVSAAAPQVAAVPAPPPLPEKAASRATMPPLGSAEMRATDFTALAERLRAEGFPPTVVRNVVEDVVGHHFAQVGYATVRPKRDPAEYWRSPVTGPATPTENAARRKLEREQSIMFEAVFGRDYRTSDDRARQYYHGISEPNVEKMKKIFADYAQMEEELRSQAASMPGLQARLEVLSREKRADLERALTARNSGSTTCAPAAPRPGCTATSAPSSRRKQNSWRCTQRRRNWRRSLPSFGAARAGRPNSPVLKRRPGAC